MAAQLDPMWLNSILIIIVGGLIVNTYNKMEKRIDSFSNEAKERAANLEKKVDSWIGCLGTMKLNIEKKVDKDMCDYQHRGIDRRNKARDLGGFRDTYS